MVLLQITVQGDMLLGFKEVHFCNVVSFMRQSLIVSQCVHVLLKYILVL